MISVLKYIVHTTFSTAMISENSLVMEVVCKMKLQAEECMRASVRYIHPNLSVLTETG